MLRSSATAFLLRWPTLATVSRSGRKMRRATACTDSGAQSEVELLWRGVGEDDPDYMATVALLRTLDDGMSTRLHHRVCDQLGLAYYVSGNLEAFADAALFEIDATSAHANVAKLLGESLALCAKLREQPPSDDELAKAKRRYRWDLEATFDDPDAMAGWWGGTELFFRPASYEEKVARVEAVGPAEVRRVAEAVFRRDRLTVAAVGLLDDRLEAKVAAALERF